METKIIEKPAMHVVGVTFQTSFREDRSKTEIPAFFHRILEEGILDSISDRLNKNQLCVFEMKRDNPDFNYTMGVEVKNVNPKSEVFTNLLLPASKYISVRIVKRGHEDVGNAFGYIFKDWMPKSIYIPTGKPAFIYYDEDFFRVYNQDGYSGNPRATIFVPIKPLLLKKIVNWLGIKKLEYT